MKRQWIIIGTLAALITLAMAAGCQNPDPGGVNPGAGSAQVTTWGTQENEPLYLVVGATGEPFTIGETVISKTSDTESILRFVVGASGEPFGTATPAATRGGTEMAPMHFVISAYGATFTPGQYDGTASITPISPYDGTENVLRFVIWATGEPFAP